MMLLICFLTLQSIVVFGQWTTSGSNIYNSNTGNVGIGFSASPFSLLEIRKYAPGTVGPIFTLTNSGGTANAVCEIDFRTFINSNPATVPSATIKAIDDGDGSAHTAFFAAQGGATNYQNEWVRIQSNGNVGIGTTSARSNLEINSGTSGISGLQFTQLTSSSATSTGNGKSLSVDSNGKVILVPSGTTIDDMNAMFAKQMEKIEELTQTVIELQKKVEALEK